eukprot:scaffold61_cov205-Alexandrium_tamarense.AAC.5
MDLNLCSIQLSLLRSLFVVECNHRVMTRSLRGIDGMPIVYLMRTLTNQIFFCVLFLKGDCWASGQ